MITIEGNVGEDGKTLVSKMPIATKAPGMVKIAFQCNTPDTLLLLCAGTLNDFGAGTVEMELASSAGPGFHLLTIIDISQLNGWYIYVLRSLGTGTSSFTLHIE